MKKALTIKEKYFKVKSLTFIGKKKGEREKKETLILNLYKITRTIKEKQKNGL